MKKILLLLTIFGGFLSMNAQGTCATAITIATSGTYTTGAINGTYKVACFNTFTPQGGGTAQGNWYKFTPNANGELTISSNLPTNDGVVKSDDTRVSVSTGLCSGTLTCVQGNDDIDDTNYLSEILNMPVVAGTTYLIEWDNRWSALPLDFTLTFTAVTCARPTVFYLPEYASTSSVDLFWDQTTVVPSNYEIDWSNNFTDAAGTGTSVVAPAGTLAYSTATISGIPASSNFRYFVRSNCGASQSNWSGPFYGYLPVNLPYSNSFEDESKNFTDGFINFTLFNSSATSNPANYADGGAGVAMYTFNSTTAASDTRAYFRGIYLNAGEIATVTFKTRLYNTATPSAPSPFTFSLTGGIAQAAASQTAIQSFTNTSDAAYTTHTATYTATTSGLYYFGIHNNTPAAATQTFLFLDAISITTNLSNNDFLASNLSVYPNPTKNIINISNTLNAVVDNVILTDLNGRVVKSQKINATEGQVNISDLATGIYMMNVTTDQGTATKKVVKE